LKEDTEKVKLGQTRGAYTADRTAALSGVPKSTIHYWAREDVLLPSISPTRVKLWSFTDLMGLRTIYWLRKRKIGTEGWDIPRTTMPAVRRALRMLSDLDLALWTEEGGPSVRVDPAGSIFLVTPTGAEALTGDRILDMDMFDLIAPFETAVSSAPDLAKPRPHLRIVPGKLSGSPHIVHTRIETLAIVALADRGFDSSRIERLYPTVRPLGAFVEAIDLERQLSKNLRVAA
jgi:uncharacterized protein (DUF433 family)